MQNDKTNLSLFPVLLKTFKEEVFFIKQMIYNIEGKIGAALRKLVSLWLCTQISPRGDFCGRFQGL